MTTAEIATELGISQRAAQAILDRALKKLRKYMFRHPDVAQNIRILLDERAESELTPLRSRLPHFEAVRAPETEVDLYDSEG